MKESSLDEVLTALGSHETQRTQVSIPPPEFMLSKYEDFRERCARSAHSDSMLRRSGCGTVGTGGTFRYIYRFLFGVKSAHPTQAMYTYSNNRQLELKLKLHVKLPSWI